MRIWSQEQVISWALLVLMHGSFLRIAKLSQPFDAHTWCWQNAWTEIIGRKSSTPAEPGSKAHLMDHDQIQLMRKSQAQIQTSSAEESDD